MKLIILGRGKTGSLVADIAREKGHDIRVLDVPENENAAALTPETVKGVDAAIDYGYNARILEKHHTQKKDAPSGTAATIKDILQLHSKAKTDIEITSLREGDTVGQHVMLFDSEDDTMMLVHDAKSRRGFAHGAVRAAEWLKGKKGFFEFKDVLRGY